MSCVKKKHYSERLQINQTHIRRFCVFKKNLYYLTYTSWPTKWVILPLIFLNGRLTLKQGLKSAKLFSCKYKRQWEVMFRETRMHPKNNTSARSCHRTTVFTKESWKSLDLYQLIWLSQTVKEVKLLSTFQGLEEYVRTAKCPQKVWK